MNREGFRMPKAHETLQSSNSGERSAMARGGSAVRYPNDGSERHSNPRELARNTASVRVLAASFEKIRLTCDFTVSGEISRA